ncbi:MAG: 2,3-bisphosphoglycerate-independent phosphoglycerate mutase [Dehalococcoidia bacterium]|nr:2,3-bisphosphoglycerate-independent phosphoglycerate mutase [Dehalococcoidia bacterium]
MIDFPYLNEICRKTDSRIVLLVVDGLGGLPHPQTGRSELETANIPNLDALASRSACGVTTPVATGITPGSGPGHLALFGYDPLKYVIGRGVLEAVGIGMDLGPDDIAIRCNFCTLDSDGVLTDRRAGRIPTSESAPLVEQLSNITVPGVEIMVQPVQDYRFVVVIRGDGLGGDVTDTDPQRTGFAPLDPAGRSDAAQRTAHKAARFIESARDILGSRDIANMILMRGFSRRPDWPAFGDAYSLNPGAVAAYPMYRGIASLLGMNVIPTGRDFDAELDTLSDHWDDHDFFFLHYKPADAAGEDGDFDAKVGTLEELDRRIPRLLDLGADVVAVAGDHSTPSTLAAHSWHPVPLMINSQSTNEGLGSPGFNERHCRSGYLGSLPATALPLLLMAHSGKLDKFGA